MRDVQHFIAIKKYRNSDWMEQCRDILSYIAITR